MRWALTMIRDCEARVFWPYQQPVPRGCQTRPGHVLGQLVRFYPDGRLAKAVMPMAVGAAIIAAMVWFNLKRERVLRQVRVVRADLASWD